MVAIEGSYRYPGVPTLLPVVGTALLLVAGTGGDHAIGRVLGSTPLVRIGDWSYSIYLWHWPVIVFAKLLFPGNGAAVAAAAVLSLGPSLASYYGVEQPIRALPMPTPRGFVRMVALTLVPVLAASAVLFVGGRSGWGLSWPDQYPKTWEPGPAGLVACPPDALGGGNEVPAGGRCVQPASARGTVLLLGDSQAESLFPGVTAAAAENGFRTVLWAKHGCPFAAGEVSAVYGFDCGQWQGDALGLATAIHPDLVVVANRSTGYVQPDLGWSTFLTAAGRPAADAGEAVALYDAALTGVVEPLTAAGVRVLVLHNIPEAERVDNEVSLLRRLVRPVTSASFDADGTLAARRPAVAVEASVADRNPGVTVFDPAPALCGSGQCPLRQGDEWLYNDRTHLSVAGAQRLVPTLADAIGEALA